VWALFLGFTVIFTYGSRETVRELLERRWRAGIGLKRVLIAGAGDLGRLVADRILQHRELGYQVVGFVDDRAGGDHIGYRGLPLLGTLAEMAESRSANASTTSTWRWRSTSTRSCSS
jgi:FlaA1/EpsC-like NDP-sugar epimerase